MNKLRIQLNEDGSVSQFTPDFKIMRGSYRNVLINLEVPHALLLDPATDTDDGTCTTGNNVRIGAIITTATGKHIQTKRYEFQWVKDFTREGTGYRLYQRRMPKEFTMWETVSGAEDTESGQVTLVINVVNWTTNSLGAQIEEVAASPKFTLDIYPSAFLDEAEEIEEPSAFDELQSQVQEIATDYTALKAELYTGSGDGLGEYLTSRLTAGDNIVLTNTDNQVKIAVDTLYASNIVLDSVDDLDADNLQTALEEISRRFDSKSVDSLTGEDDYLVDNSDPNNPVVMHDTSKVDVTTFDGTINGLNSAIFANAEGISELNTNLASYSLISATGANIDLDIDTTNYVMTLALKNTSGDTLSSQTIDFPLESVVVGASYKTGTLTLTLQNGTTLDIDISSIIDGLVSQTDFDMLTAQVEANTANIATNTENIASNATNISTNASAIATETSERTSADKTLQDNIDNEAATRANADTELQSQITSNDDDIAALQTADTTLQTNINEEAQTRANADTDLQSQITANTDNIATNTSDIAGLKTQVETNKTNLELLTAGVDLSALQSQQGTNTANIATNASNISSLQTSVDANTLNIASNATAISTETSNRTAADSNLQTNIDNLKLTSGAMLDLSIDESTYVMTVQLKNSVGTVLSTETVDLPLETMVVSASYSDGKVYLTLKNGTQLDAIDISDIISGLASQTDLDSEISARTSADSTLQSNINSVDSSAVHLAGTETITGSKNFTGTFQISGGTITYDASTDTFTI